MYLTIKQPSPAFDQIMDSLKALGRKQVKVGLPPSAGGQRSILAIQEHGSPMAHIPARPVINPALSSPQVRQAMAAEMLQAVQSVWSGDESGGRAGLEAAGQAGADGIRAYIDAGVSPPNAPITVSGGWMYNRAAHKAVYIPGKGINKPLYDTGALYGAFGYEIDSD